MPASRISIFDIPLVVEAICDHLTTKDIWRCYRVNKSWSDLFSPHRCKHIQFLDLDSTQTWYILNNAHHIRELKVDLADATDLLNSSCTRLEKLSCVNFGYMTWPSTVHQDEWALDFTPRWIDLEPSINALSLIKMNPRLRELNILWYPAIGIPVRPFTPTVLSALSSHRFLRSMSISLRSTHKELVALLTHCPPHLEELELQCKVSYPFGEEGQHIPLVLSGPTNLRCLIVRDTFIRDQPNIFSTLLKYCPLLEKVELPQAEGSTYRDFINILVEHCPKLQSFHQGMTHSLIASSDAARLLNGYPNGLREVKLNVYISDGDPTSRSQEGLMRPLAAYYFNVLEVLRLQVRMGPISARIVSLLGLCPRLRVLEVIGNITMLDEIVSKERWKVLMARLDGAIDSTADAQTELLPWVCSRLESLMLHIAKPSIKRIGTVMLQKHPMTEDAIEEVSISTIFQAGLFCQTLKSLRCLTNLELTWEASIVEAVGMIPYDRGSLYMERVGLPRVSQKDMLWMGIEWSTVTDR
ncbi:hypothetical protein BC939DRAFT_434114 [Gamsiella multidivaricata]|uniref:uncharacterized protein n=1 Tax=Gamsiella multidivaricata TaxID=101098 RepID=UPI00221E7A51|nr:uncharacterized protein BC939DRAFT_434114 [Gamsiella multidivaricata]KAG0365176.1 hypothetical protein BGZ54_006790 [Gamsiella multidivaricata]KAI7832703.1 hypothetical protein BC939DRAFT_434114 [Gamsiella multidivaricata]